MQRFQFRLERVLEWRRKKCRMEENSLAACLGHLNAADQGLVQLRSERNAIDREILARSPIPAPDFAHLGLYRLRAAKEEQQLIEERTNRARAAAQQRMRVLRAQQRVKLLEKLRERRLEEYMLLAGRELEQAAGEAYLSRWVQARSAGRPKPDRAARDNRAEGVKDLTATPCVKNHDIPIRQHPLERESDR